MYNGGGYVQIYQGDSLSSRRGSGSSGMSAGERLSMKMSPGSASQPRKAHHPPPPLTYTTPIGSQPMGVIYESPHGQAPFVNMSSQHPLLQGAPIYSGYSVHNTGTPRHQGSPPVPPNHPAYMPASPMRSDAELVSTPGGSRTPGARTPGQRPGMGFQASMGAATLPFTPGSPASPMHVAPSRLTWGAVEQKQIGRTRLVGMQQAPLVGLRVLLSEQGKQVLANDDLGPKLSRGRPGFISKVHPEGDACMVLWDIVRKEDGGESGWYRCGAYGHYTLEMTDYSNSDSEIIQRQEQLKNNTISVYELGFT